MFGATGCEELRIGRGYRSVQGTGGVREYREPNWREIDDAIIKFATGTDATRASIRKFATVLFTDIVGSTRQSAERGDAAWRAVLDSHDRIARGLIDEHEGRVVKSTGDGLLVTFEAPSQGVACAVSLRNALATARSGHHQPCAT